MKCTLLYIVRDLFLIKKCTKNPRWKRGINYISFSPIWKKIMRNKKINTVIVCDSSQLMNKTVSYISVEKKSLSNEKFLVCYRHQSSLTFFKRASFLWLKIKFHDFFPDLNSWHVAQPNIIYRVHAGRTSA